MALLVFVVLIHVVKCRICNIHRVSWFIPAFSVIIILLLLLMEMYVILSHLLYELVEVLP